MLCALISSNDEMDGSSKSIRAHSEAVESTYGAIKTGIYCCVLSESSISRAYRISDDAKSCSRA